MIFYKDNRFYFGNISFCLPDDVYLNVNCQEYDDCIELQPSGSDFRIIIFMDYSESGAKQFFTKDEEKVCYRLVGEVTPIVLGTLTGYSISYSSKHNAYAEYRFDMDGNEKNIFGILIHVKTPVDMTNAINHPAVFSLFQSIEKG